MNSRISEICPPATWPDKSWLYSKTRQYETNNNCADVRLDGPDGKLFP